MHASGSGRKHDIINRVSNVRVRKIDPGGKVSRDAGPVKGGKTVIAFADDPTGYKWELIQRPEPIPEPIAQVHQLQQSSTPFSSLPDEQKTTIHEMASQAFSTGVFARHGFAMWISCCLTA